MRQKRRHAPPSDDVQSAILRRVARGYLIRTNRVLPNGNARVEYQYDGGASLPPGAKERTIDRMIAAGVLVPIKGETLYGDVTAAQRYRTRTTEEM